MIIRNCRLIRELTEGTGLAEADVVLRGGLIERIVPCRTITAGEEEELDIKGSTLMPGLIDMHVHLIMGKKNPLSEEDRAAVPSRRALDSLRYAQFLLDLGYTTVRDVGDDRGYGALAARNAVNEGDFAGPNIVCSGLTISPKMAGFETCGFMTAFINDASDMRRVVREQFAHGADFIKLYGTGSMMLDGSHPGSRIMEEDEIQEAVTLAGRLGSYCACHCHGAEAIEVMIDLGVHTIEHASLITEEACRKLDGRRDIGIVPTIACTCREMNEIEGMSREEIEEMELFNQKREACIKNVCQNHNILMGWGTDLAMESYARAPYLEWKQRKEIMGFSNLDLLKQATVNGAILMRMEDRIGTVKEGKWADLIVVDGDPKEDIRVMYQKPTHVIKGGRLVR